MAESKYSKYVISERRFDSRDAALPAGVDPESVTNTRSHRKILSLDDVVLEGLRTPRRYGCGREKAGSIPRPPNPCLMPMTMTRLWVFWY